MKEDKQNRIICETSVLKVLWIIQIDSAFHQQLCLVTLAKGLKVSNWEWPKSLEQRNLLDSGLLETLNQYPHL